jgi:hypothetical protein
LALADAIDRLLRDPARARAIGDRAAGRAAAEYDLSRMVGRYAAVYRELLTARGRLTAEARPHQSMEAPGTHTARRKREERVPAR